LNIESTDVEFNENKFTSAQIATMVLSSVAMALGLILFSIRIYKKMKKESENYDDTDDGNHGENNADNEDQNNSRANSFELGGTIDNPNNERS
jgi:predicted histidine transporter YuiF (NhaC family)